MFEKLLIHNTRLEEIGFGISSSFRAFPAEYKSILFHPQYNPTLLINKQTYSHQ